MKIIINGTTYILPNVVENEDGTHSIDKNTIIQEYIQARAKTKDVYTWYETNGIKNACKHKKACKDLYSYYIEKLQADYIAMLVFPEKSKSVYGVAIIPKEEKRLHDIIGDNTEITINSRGKWVLRLRIKNSAIVQLAKMGTMLLEWTPFEFNNVMNDTRKLYEVNGFEFANTGQLFEAWYNDFTSSVIWTPNNDRFDKSYDVLDTKTDTKNPLKVQCKSQKASIASLDLLASL